MKNQQSATKQDVTDLRNEVKADITDLRSEVKAEFAAVRKDLEALEVRLREYVHEIVQEMETKLLRAFYGFAESNQN